MPSSDRWNVSRGCATLAVGLALVVGAVAFAGTGPDAATMVYRGNLQQNGAPFTGQVDMSFDFYDAQGNCLNAAGSPCPSSAGKVQVLDGEFSVTLGLPPDVLGSQSPAIQGPSTASSSRGASASTPCPSRSGGGPTVRSWPRTSWT